MSRISTISTLALALFSSVPACAGGPPKPGEEAFERANDTLDKYESKVGFGDEVLATAFATKAKAIDTELFSGGASRLDDATTEGHWMAYVERKGSTTLFMVRVPLLKTYKGADREALVTDVLWEAARSVAPPDVQSGEVVVAARGAVAYGAVARGKLDGAPKVEAAVVVDTAPLYKVFDKSTQ